MPVARRLPLAAACAAVGAACATTPAFTWLSATGHPGRCGWTCYVPTTQAPPIATLAGRGGTQVAGALGVLLVVVALLAVVAAVMALRPAGPPVLLGWAIVAAGFAALVWTVLVIVRYAEGGTLVRTPRDGVFSANPAFGAIAGLVATAAAVLLGGLLALRPDAPATPVARS